MTRTLFILLAALVIRRANADDALPKALIIGDSFSIGDTKPLTDLLKGKIAVSRMKANCGDTRAGLASINRWFGDGKWDVIHFNCGLQALCFCNPGPK